jgi:glyoxylase-like metal-dependent hydrolase (beta-lactamase superfamily II)
MRMTAAETHHQAAPATSGGPDIKAFFDEPTFTVSYVVSDPATRASAIVDSVLDYEPASGRTSTTSADAIIAYVREQGLTVQWILETHVHADHLTAAPYLKTALGGRTAIGFNITTVQQTFKTLFNAEPGFAVDGSQFDHLLQDGETFQVGGLTASAMHAPGHTPACMVYRIGDAAFVGDTLFMPDYGTARCDFPGGDARTLYRSIQKILGWPDRRSACRRDRHHHADPAEPGLCHARRPAAPGRALCLDPAAGRLRALRHQPDARRRPGRRGLADDGRRGRPDRHPRHAPTTWRRRSPSRCSPGSS